MSASGRGAQGHIAAQAQGVRGRSRPVETSRPKGFSWERLPEALAPGTTFSNLQYKRQRKEKAVRVG